MPILKVYSAFTMPSGNTGGSLIVDVLELYYNKVQFTASQISLPLRDTADREMLLLIKGSGFLGTDVNAMKISSFQIELAGRVYVTLSDFSLNYAGLQKLLTALDQNEVRQEFWVGADKFLGSNGNDMFQGYAGNDTLLGNSGNDTLDGGVGNDVLRGGQGKDLMTGGLGNDLFDFDAITDTGLLSSTRDVIKDFKSGQDRIDLSTIDANQQLPGNQAFLTPIIGGAFSGAMSRLGELYFDKTAHLLYGNTDTDNVPEFAIELTGLGILDAKGVIL